MAKHATRAAAPFVEIPEIGITICPTIIPAADSTHYKNLFDSIVGRANVGKCRLDDLVDNAALQQDSAVLSMIKKKIKPLCLDMDVLIPCPLSAQLLHQPAGALIVTTSLAVMG